MPNAISTERLNRITSTIIDSAIRIHRAIGPGLLEKAYLGCLCFELHSAGMRIETQKALPLVYRGVNIECAYRADLIVEGLVINCCSQALVIPASPDSYRALRGHPIALLCVLCGLCVEKLRGLPNSPCPQRPATTAAPSRST